MQDKKWQPVARDKLLKLASSCLVRQNSKSAAFSYQAKLLYNSWKKKGKTIHGRIQQKSNKTQIESTTITASSEKLCQLQFTTEKKSTTEKTVSISIRLK